MARRRGPTTEERERVHSRLASLRARDGWVPRVPEPLPDVAHLAGPAPDAESWPAADAWFGPLPGADGVDRDGDEGPAPGAPGQHAPPGPRGRHRAAMGDRVPVAVRAAVARGLPEPVRDGRMRLGPAQAGVVLLVAVVALAGAAVVVWVSRPQVQPVPAVDTVVEAAGTPVPVAAAGSPEPAGSAPATAGAAGVTAGGSPTGVVVVHVAGLVARPGVVRLPAGSRVSDALDAAGGPQPGVDLTPLNLARPLADGEQVLVGVAPPEGAVAAGGALVPGPGDPSAPAGGDPRVDINTATADQLEELPGIGPVIAARIVAWREQHGRFGSTEELREVSGIGPRTFEALADLVRV